MLSFASIFCVNKLIVLPLLLFGSCPKPNPIGFSIPEAKVVEKMPAKDQNFAYVRKRSITRIINILILR
jgi:hypothetical protein